MKIETLKWAAQQFRDLAPRWARDAQPVYNALGMGTGARMVGGEYTELPVPTVEELRDWVIETANSFEGENMRYLAKQPRNKTYMSFVAHSVLFWASDDEDGRGCGISIHINSVSISGGR